MTSRQRIDPDDEMSIDYYPSGRPAPESPAATKAKVLTALRKQLDIAEAHVAAGHESVDGASQSYAVASLRSQIATWEAR